MLVSLRAEGTFVSLVGPGLDHRRPSVSDRLDDLSRRYRRAREAADAAPLLCIGQDLYDWLNGAEGWLAELLPKLTPPFLLEIEGPLKPTASDWAILQAPWELLADENGFLAADADRRYAPARRLGKRINPPALDEYRLGVAFMAASPFGAKPLDFEAEETAIMNAAGRDLDLLVEESGDPEELGRRLSKLKTSLPVLHLSCHGHNAWRGRDGKQAPQPVLMLEHAATGEERPTTASDLADALGAYRPSALFLSACLTAAAGDAPSGPGVILDSMVSRLVAHIPAVLGWDGSVADVAATAFARELYDDLGKKLPLPVAAANARRALLTGVGTSGVAGADKRVEPSQLEQQLEAHREALRRDWHLARVWLGPEGGGPVVDGHYERSLVPPDAGAKQLLTVKRGERLEVADPSVFVGRRRELKQALRLLAGHDKAALLLHGMGRLGKSSLAGRIIDRLPDLTPVVVFAAYDALSIVDALAKALEEHEGAARIIAEWRPQIRDDLTAFRQFLVKLLSGPCKWTKEGGKPILLLIDDLERVLDPDPAGGRHLVRAEVRPVLSALLNAFTPQRSNSRLLLTSRFPFSLTEDGRDLAQSVAELELSEFTETSRRKLALRQIKAAQADGLGFDEAALKERLPLLAQAQAVARGNPGLQDLLGSDFVLRPAVPVARAEAILAEMEIYLKRGAMPKTEEVRGFLQNLAIDKLLNLAGAASKDLLRAMTLFEVPVPEAVLEAFASLGGDARRLRDLGLLTPAEDLIAADRTAVTVNGLAAGRLAPLAAAEKVALSKLAAPCLFTAWGGADGRNKRPYEADIELTRLAIPAGEISVLTACAGDAVSVLSQSGNPDGAAELGQQAIAAMEAAGAAPPLRLLARTAEACQTAGNGAEADAILAKGPAPAASDSAHDDLGQLSNFLFQQGLRQSETGDVDGALATFKRLCNVEERRGNDHQLAVARGQIANILQDRGNLDEALRICTDQLLPVFTLLGDVREVAITQGKIADILRARGELDEALRILTEQLLPVFTRLGDVSAVAVTQGKIADILQARGELDEALRIRTEQQLPVFTRLGDVRAVAITQGQIADILQARGELDKALRILTEQLLPVFTRLGDVSAVAVTQGKIADILQARGELDEALRIRIKQQLPVFTRLGDVREVAITQGKIADILQARGELDEALRIRAEQQLPVFARLGDVRAVAITQGKIADIMQARGELDKALRIRTEQELPVYTRLGDVSAIAITQGQIADILQARGDLDEALRIRTEQELPVYTRLGDVREVTITQGKIADILQARGELDEALRIRAEQQLPVYTRLGDVRAVAVTQGKIADILQARGELDEALRIRTEQQLPVFTRLGDVRAVAITQGQIADILQARGELDEALRIRAEQQLPVYTRLGDVRAVAVTQGKIADILQDRGELDEAVRLHEQRLETNRRLGDIDGIASSLWSIARIELERNQLAEAATRLAEAWPLVTKLGRPDGMAAIGSVFGQFLAAADQEEWALEVLGQAAESWRKLGQIDRANQIEAMRADIRARAA